MQSLALLQEVLRLQLIKWTLGLCMTILTFQEHGGGALMQAIGARIPRLEIGLMLSLISRLCEYAMHLVMAEHSIVEFMVDIAIAPGKFFLQSTFNFSEAHMLSIQMLIGIPFFFHFIQASCIEQKEAKLHWCIAQALRLSRFNPVFEHLSF